MAIAHNGNLVNSSELREELELQGSIFHTTSDTEVISYIITKERLSAPSIEEAVNRAMNRIRGAYSLVVMSPSKLIAVAGRKRLPSALLRQARGRLLRHRLREPARWTRSARTFIREIEAGRDSCVRQGTACAPSPTTAVRQPRALLRV